MANLKTFIVRVGALATLGASLVGLTAASPVASATTASAAQPVVVSADNGFGSHRAWMGVNKPNLRNDRQGQSEELVFTEIFYLQNDQHGGWITINFRDCQGRGHVQRLYVQPNQKTLMHRDYSNIRVQKGHRYEGQTTVEQANPITVTAIAQA